MLMYGEARNIFEKDCIIFNLTSLVEGFPRLVYLIPPNTLGKLSGRDFDLAYASYVFENDLPFRDFFAIIYNLYIGNDVFIVVSDSDWSENLIESLLKLIQQRYGYNANRIDSYEDYLYFCTCKSNSDFNPYFGIMNLDMDKERYAYILEAERLKNGGAIYG